MTVQNDYIQEQITTENSDPKRIISFSLPTISTCKVTLTGLLLSANADCKTIQWEFLGKRTDEGCLIIDQIVDSMPNSFDPALENATITIIPGIGGFSFDVVGLEDLEINWDLQIYVRTLY